MAAEKWISEPMRPASSLTPAAFAMPALTCDSHMHVFGPVEDYPGVADAKYTKPEGDLAQYLEVAERLRYRPDGVRAGELLRHRQPLHPGRHDAMR